MNITKALGTLLFISSLVSAQVKAPVHVAPKTKQGFKAKVTRTATGHSATLSCTDSTANVQFNFYRGTTSGQESTTPLNSTPTATCNYVDSTVSPLTTYYYTAKAYLSTAPPPGLSNPSNEVQAVIPGDPLPAAPVLSVGTVAKNSVPLLWKTPVQAGYQVIAYELYRGTQSTLSSSSLLYILPSLAAAYTDTTCEGKCYYELKSYTIDQDKKFMVSGPSNIVSN